MVVLCVCVLQNLTESWCILYFAPQPLQLCGGGEAPVSHYNVSTSHWVCIQLTKTSAARCTGSYGRVYATTRTHPGFLIKILLFSLECEKSFTEVGIVLRCCWICWSLEWILNKLWMHLEFMYTMTKKVSRLKHQCMYHSHQQCKNNKYQHFSCRVVG